MFIHLLYTQGYVFPYPGHVFLWEILVELILVPLFHPGFSSYSREVNGIVKYIGFLSHLMKCCSSLLLLKSVWLNDDNTNSVEKYFKPFLTCYRLQVPSNTFYRYPGLNEILSTYIYRTFIPSNEILLNPVFIWNAAFISFKAITCCSQNIPDLMESILDFF